MLKDGKIWIGVSKNMAEDRGFLLPSMANRHGLIAGATGTGKTVTLKVLAEGFSDCGVPVFLSDVKGDLSGMCLPGKDSDDIEKHRQRFGLGDDFAFHACPVCFWDILQESGHPLRTTISEMGPVLLAELLELNETQRDILSIVFKIADDRQLLLLDIKDLRLMLQYVGENTREFTLEYGNITKQSLGAISRSLVSLEEQGGNLFFGEPAFDIRDWMRTDAGGHGYINILHSVKLIRSPRLYATFMLWMMSELFEEMPEAGDLEKPRMVFFFDEAHLLFDSASKGLLQKIEQMVKLIRSKGVGIYFITQNPADIPDGILSQLGNRVQHALRAYTPADQKAVRAAAQSFRENPEFSTEQKITELGTGEALVSCLDEEGRPSVVKECCILPPQSLMGSIDEAERKNCLFTDGLGAKYDTAVDRESAYEILKKRFEEEEAAEQKAKEEAAAEKARKEQERQEEKERKEKERAAREAERAAEKERKEKERQEKERRKKTAVLERGVNTAVNTLGREVTRTLFRGLMSTLKKH